MTTSSISSALAMTVVVSGVGGGGGIGEPASETDDWNSTVERRRHLWRRKTS